MGDSRKKIPPPPPHYLRTPMSLVPTAVDQPDDYQVTGYYAIPGYKIIDVWTISSVPWQYTPRFYVYDLQMKKQQNLSISDIDIV